ncbi:MAG: serine/threonine-protein kinase [Solirubrobacteraceae bacterium]|nr:serine/threonine-protein kinase [Solirubrobacteraceae bacterium]
MRQSVSEGRHVGAYRIIRSVGPAVGGTLFEAEDLERKRLALLRVIAPQLAASAGFRARFMHEQKLAAAFYHPHVLTIFDAGEADGTLYVATRLVAGRWLDALLAAGGALQYARATELVVQLAGALDEAHSRGLVHRGLRPSSIVVASEPAEHAYLTDFGLTDDTSQYGGLSRAPAGMAPPGADYAAPEQIAGRPVDARTDVYALGCLAFRLVTGAVPYEADDERDTLAAHLGAAPPSAVALAPSVPHFFDRVIARAMAKDPADRFASAGELAAALPSKPRVLSRWRSMIEAGTMETGALDAAAEAVPAAPGTAGRAPGAPAAATPPVGPDSYVLPEPGEDVRSDPYDAPEPGEDFEPDPDDAPEPGEDFGLEPDDSLPPTTRADVRRETIGSATAEPSLPPAADERRRTRRAPRRWSRREPLVLALIGLCVAGVLVVAGVLTDGGADPPSAADPRPPLASVAGRAGDDQDAGDQPAAISPTLPEPAADERLSVSPWPPNRRAYTAVVYTSPGDRAEALRRARRAAALGYRSGVLRSDDFSNLELGLWVTFAGVYDGPERAERAVARLRSAGIARAPYVRLVDGGSGS